jgi:hypothetical protein
MVAISSMITLEPPAIDEPMLVVLTTRTPEPIGLADFVLGSLTYLLDSVKPVKLTQGAAFLELNVLRNIARALYA